MKYQSISIEIRQAFINKVLTKQCTIKQAAKEFGLKLSTSKAILQTYKKEGRIGKKKQRTKKKRIPSNQTNPKENLESQKETPLNVPMNMPISSVPTSFWQYQSFQLQYQLYLITQMQQLQMNGFQL